MPRGSNNSYIYIYIYMQKKLFGPCCTTLSPPLTIWRVFLRRMNSGFSSVPENMPKKANAALLAMSQAVHSFISLYIWTLIAPSGWAWIPKEQLTQLAKSTSYWIILSLGYLSCSCFCFLCFHFRLITESWFILGDRVNITPLLSFIVSFILSKLHYILKFMGLYLFELGFRSYIKNHKIVLFLKSKCFFCLNTPYLKFTYYALLDSLN